MNNNDSMNSFGQAAKGLARSPLGIIALFIVLIYGVGALITAFSTWLTPQERMPLIWFLVIFPILVLIVFAWLVVQHSSKLFGPGDFAHEENFLRMQLIAAASIAAAATSPGKEIAESRIETIVNAVRQAPTLKPAGNTAWRSQILWVDDRPDGNVYLRLAFESYGLRFTLARSTNDALELLSQNKYAAIISDMGREEGPREGYVLLDSIRAEGDQTPFVIFSGSNLPEHKREAAKHGAQGATNTAEELFPMVLTAVVTRL